MAKSFGATVQRYRNERNLTQTQVAKKFGVSRRTIARIEAGEQIGERLYTFISKLIQTK